MASKSSKIYSNVYVAKLDKFLHDQQPINKYLDIFEEKTQLPRIYVGLGGVVVLLLYLAIGYGAQFLANLIGFAYPSYASIKAIESKQKDDDTKWLTYWVVFACFGLIEYFADILLFWIPFYWLIKTLFLAYLWLPVTNGSIKLYRTIIRPTFLKHEGKLDEMATAGEKLATDLNRAATDKAAQLAADAASAAVVGSAANDDDKTEKVE